MGADFVDVAPLAFASTGFAATVPLAFVAVCAGFTDV